MVAPRRRCVTRLVSRCVGHAGDHRWASAAESSDSGRRPRPASSSSLDAGSRRGTGHVLGPPSRSYGGNCVRQSSRASGCCSCGGDPTADKPSVTFGRAGRSRTRRGGDDLRRAGLPAAYDVRARAAAEFLTPPVEYAWEVRAFFRDPDAHLFEISEARGRASTRKFATGRRPVPLLAPRLDRRRHARDRSAGPARPAATTRCTNSRSPHPLCEGDGDACRRRLAFTACGTLGAVPREGLAMVPRAWRARSRPTWAVRRRLEVPSPTSRQPRRAATRPRHPRRSPRRRSTSGSVGRRRIGIYSLRQVGSILWWNGHVRGRAGHSCALRPRIGTTSRAARSCRLRSKSNRRTYRVTGCLDNRNVDPEGRGPRGGHSSGSSRWNEAGAGFGATMWAALSTAGQGRPSPSPAE